MSTEMAACRNPDCERSEFQILPDGTVICADENCCVSYGQIAGAGGVPAPDIDPGDDLLAMQAGRDEARAMLREVRDILLEGGQDHLTARRRALAIIDARPEVTR